MLKLDQKIFYITLSGVIAMYIILLIYTMFVAEKPVINFKDYYKMKDFYREKSKSEGNELVFDFEKLKQIRNNEKYDTYIGNKFIATLENEAYNITYKSLNYIIENSVPLHYNKFLQQYYIYFIGKAGMNEEFDMKKTERIFFGRELKEPLTDFEKVIIDQ